MSCKAVHSGRSRDRDIPFGSESRLLFDLREDDGMLVVARRWSDTKQKLTREEIVALSHQSILLVNKQYPKGKELPIQDVEGIESRSAAYSEYAKKYTFVGWTPKGSQPGRQTNWPEKRPQPVYLMDKNGNVEIVEIPKSEEWSGIFMAMPSREGLVFGGGHGRTGGGLYVYNGKQVEAIDRGRVGTFSVSPNGCKVAYSIVNQYGPGDNEFVIKFVNLCNHGK